MTLTFDIDVYNDLLTEFSPKPIETEQEYDRALKVAEQLTFTKNHTPETQAFYRLLVTLIEAYETENYPMNTPAPYEILQHLMESSGTNISDLVGVIGSLDIVSEVVAGKREIDIVQAQALGDYYKVAPRLFLRDS